MIFDTLVAGGRALAWFLLPPAGLLVTGALGALLSLRARRAGIVIAGLSLLGLILLSMPIASFTLLSLASVTPDTTIGGAKPGAIVVLAADVRQDAQEYGGITIGSLTLARLRYAARLHRKTELPILVSGGPIGDGDPALAVLMREALAEDFRAEAAWIEPSSRNTAENARYSAEILRREGITTALVVTHAWHMRRALLAFEGTGLTAIPAPTLAPGRPTGWDMFVPSTAALHASYLGVHELVGTLFYRFLRWRQSAS